ncbi:hypothetical protein BsWGS_16148 [Bradybaena similaris]
MAPNNYELKPVSNDNRATKGDNDGPETSEKTSVEINLGATVELKRELGLPGGVSFIVGAIIGSGIFVSPKGVLEYTGSVALCLIIWGAAGLISLLGSLCYCELGTLIPKSGGEYSYLRLAYGNLLAFLYTWVSVLLTRPASLAIMSLTFGANFSSVFEMCGVPELPQKLAALACLLTILLLNCYSIKLSAWLQIATTVAKVAALFVIIFGGIYKMTQGYTAEISTGFQGSASDGSVVAYAFYSALWAYDGWNNLNYVTEELKKPHRNLPRANLISIVLVIVIYVLTNLCYLTVLTKSEMLASNAVAMLWGDRVLHSAAIIMPIAVMISTLGSTNSNAFSGGRSLLAAARDGNFPEVLSFINVKQLTPIPSMVVTIVLAVIFVLVGSIESLIDFFSICTWLFYGLTFSTVVYFRFKMRDAVRPYKVPIPIPVCMVIIAIYLVIAPIVNKPEIQYLYVIVFLVAGALVYFPFVHFKLKLPYFDSFTMWVQLIFEAVPCSKFID